MIFVIFRESTKNGDSPKANVFRDRKFIKSIKAKDYKVPDKEKIEDFWFLGVYIGNSELSLNGKHLSGGHESIVITQVDI
jgi:hypothetical protein